MKIHVFCAILCALSYSIAQPALAAEWNADQQSLWQFVAASWEDDAKETGKWPGAYVHDSVRAWDADWPVPRGKASMAKWTTFRDGRMQLLEYELFPQALVVEGNTGVAFYSVVEVRQIGDGEVERNVTGLVETAIRDGKSWKYIGLTSFDIDDED